VTVPVAIDFRTGRLRGSGVVEITRTLGDLGGIFRDEAAWRAMDPATIAYRVQSYQPVEDGREGGLFWGTTFLEPGLVGDEYFMTKGHLHSKRDRAEFYVTVSGRGALILMDAGRTTRFEPMTPGSVHYIPGLTAHRVANTGDETLSFTACWPSDAGHDYETVARFGFGARLRRIEGEPQLVAEP
jgi:glucose-6-phosphate isomerase